ncbi:glycosyltransferase family 9 protein [Salegentibacter sp. LM13S]|uniref:glycosyltransferase family 9 protein n=1 Tax=Salegentibacter lacus TaxID=2873599 RepID=UPI001CCBC389|nr:glycosyltransferase family 9 protein [Salegentibacter lacus]MBZ9630587.1 glycosyltransferase family 9 protein [Salegentibacter lacus]
MKILIIQNKRIGDVLIASIIPANLKKTYPNSVIFFLCNQYAAPVLDNNPHIDRLIVIQEYKLKEIISLSRIAHFLRKEKFDVIIDPYVKLGSQFLSLFSGAKKRISYKKRTLPGAYTHQVSFLTEKTSTYGKAIDERLNLIKVLDSSEDLLINPQIFLTQKEIEEGKKMLSSLDSSRKTIIFGLLGSNRYKSLPESYIVELINFVADNYQVNILFNYMPSQLEEASCIISKIKPSEKIYKSVFCEGLRDFIKIAYHCDGMIANEGGSVHIVKAFKKPTFTIFSPFIPKESWGTFENEPQNQSIHLNEIKPELLKNKTQQSLYKESLELYKELSPFYILPELKRFMSRNFINSEIGSC